MKYGLKKSMRKFTVPFLSQFAFVTVKWFKYHTVLSQLFNPVV